MSEFVAESMAPIQAFRFQVDFKEHRIGATEPTGGELLLCSGSFSQCSGLEATMEPKVINEGGRNYGAAQRVGRVTFGTVVLKRGVTSNRHLWKWFELVANGAYAYRLTTDITVLGPDDSQVRWVWRLSHCLPTKFRVPDLDAKTDQIAIEELHLAHEGMQLVPEAGGGT